MALSLATVGGKITAAFVSAIIAVVNRQGSTGVIPTSVAGTGVALATTGVVTFTAATSVSINGCFTSQFDNYLIEVDLVLVSGSFGNGTIRFRVGGVDNSAASYTTVGFFSDGSSTAHDTGSSGATSGVFSYNYSGNDGIQWDMVVKKPYLTTKTVLNMQGTNSSTYLNRSIVQTTATSFDGITFIPFSAATGTIRIIGIANN